MGNKKGRGTTGLLCPYNEELVQALDAALDEAYPLPTVYSIGVGYGLRGEEVYINGVTIRGDGVKISKSFRSDEEVQKYIDDLK